MVWILIAVVIVVVIVVIALEKRRSRPGPAPQAPPPVLTVAGRYAIVGRDADDDHGQGLPKLADNVGLAITVDYRNAQGRASRRIILIDGVFGRSLDWPTYVIGLDSATGERRTFHLDRIEAMHREGLPPLTASIPWWVGAWVKARVDLPLNRPPFSARFVKPVTVSERKDGQLRTWTGLTRMVDLDYRTGEAVLRFIFDEATPGAERPYRTHAFQPLTDSKRAWTLEEVIDGETGEVVGDIIGWAATCAGLTQDGLAR